MSSVSPKDVQEVLGKHMLVDVVPIIVDLENSKGNRLRDSASGKDYLDCFSYIASNPIGHNHPSMFEPNFEKALLKASRAKPANSDFYTVELAEFVECFSQLAKPDHFEHLFFIEGGALAVENAMKAAFDWKVRKNIAAGRGSHLGTRILHFEQAFHGRSGYTLSVTNTADPRKIKFFPKFEWPRVLNPKVHFPLDDETEEKVIEAEQESIRQIKQAFTDFPNDIAAILIEPIQGEGGDNHFRSEFHQTLKKLAVEHEALLIYDEVQSGMGLTGKMWAHEHYGVLPDIVCFGKKSQVCGIMAGERIDEVENNVFSEVSRINSTWGGALADMVRCQQYLNIIESENLVQNAADVGAYLVNSLEEMAATSSGVLTNARGKGLMAAIDAKSPEHRDKLFIKCFEKGVLILKCGLKTLRFRPSLTFSRSEVDELISVLNEVSRE